MIELLLSRDADGTLRVAQIPPLLDSMLRELPSILSREQPDAVQRRLYPDPGGDPETVAEWRRAQHPELFALLADARAIVERDLASLTMEEEGSRLVIPAAHVNAWISALNAVRLTLGARYEFTAQEMDDEGPVTPDERGVAMLMVDELGRLQQSLILAMPPC